MAQVLGAPSTLRAPDLTSGGRESCPEVLLMASSLSMRRWRGPELRGAPSTGGTARGSLCLMRGTGQGMGGPSLETCMAPGQPGTWHPWQRVVASREQLVYHFGQVFSGSWDDSGIDTHIQVCTPTHTITHLQAHTCKHTRVISREWLLLCPFSSGGSTG